MSSRPRRACTQNARYTEDPLQLVVQQLKQTKRREKDKKRKRDLYQDLSAATEEFVHELTTMVTNICIPCEEHSLEKSTSPRVKREKDDDEDDDEEMEDEEDEHPAMDAIKQELDAEVQRMLAIPVEERKPIPLALLSERTRLLKEMKQARRQMEDADSKVFQLTMALNGKRGEAAKGLRAEMRKAKDRSGRQLKNIFKSRDALINLLASIPPAADDGGQKDDDDEEEGLFEPATQKKRLVILDEDGNPMEEPEPAKPALPPSIMPTDRDIEMLARRNIILRKYRLAVSECDRLLEDLNDSNSDVDDAFSAGDIAEALDPEHINDLEENVYGENESIPSYVDEEGIEEEVDDDFELEEDEEEEDDDDDTSSSEDCEEPPHRRRKLKVDKKLTSVSDDEEEEGEKKPPKKTKRKILEDSDSEIEEGPRTALEELEDLLDESARPEREYKGKDVIPLDKLGKPIKKGGKKAQKDGYDDEEEDGDDDDDGVEVLDDDDEDEEDDEPPKKRRKITSGLSDLAPWHDPNVEKGKPKSLKKKKAKEQGDLFGLSAAISSSGVKSKKKLVKSDTKRSFAMLTPTDEWD